MRHCSCQVPVGDRVLLHETTVNKGHLSEQGVHRVPAEVQISLSLILPTSLTEKRQNSRKRSLEVRVLMTYHVRQSFVSEPAHVSKRFLISANLPHPIVTSTPESQIALP
jgi:hypothetical protein